MPEPINLAQATNTIPGYISINDVGKSRVIEITISKSEFMQQFYQTPNLSTLNSTIELDNSANENITYVRGKFLAPGETADSGVVEGSNNDVTLLQFLRDTYVADLSLNSLDDLSSSSRIFIQKSSLQLNQISNYSVGPSPLTRSEFNTLFQQEIINIDPVVFELSLFIVDSNYSSSDLVTSITRTETSTLSNGTINKVEKVCIPPLTVRPIELKLLFNITESY